MSDMYSITVTVEFNDEKNNIMKSSAYTYFYTSDMMPLMEALEDACESASCNAQLAICTRELEEKYSPKEGTNGSCE